MRIPLAIKYALIACLSLPSASWAAITADATSQAEGTTTTATASHTFGGTANFALMCVGVRDSGGAVAAPTGVTVDGNAATKIADALNPNNVVLASLWRYNNPPVGAVNVVATGAAGTDFILLIVRSYSGVDTGNPVGTAVEFEPGGATTNVDTDTVSSAVNDVAAWCGVARKGTANITFAADATVPVSTEVLDITHTSGAAQISLGFYEEAGASPTVDLRVDASESVQTAAVGVSIHPSVVATTRKRGVVFLP